MPEEASRSPLEDLAELLENGEAEERHGALDTPLKDNRGKSYNMH